MNLLASGLVLATGFTSLGASALYLVHYRRSDPASGRVASLLAGLGWAFLGILLLMRALEQGYVPLGSLNQSLFIFLWLLMGSYLVVERRYDLRVAGGLFWPSLTLVLLAALAWVPQEASPDIARNLAVSETSIFLHVAFNFLAYSSFALAGVAGLIYLLQERQIKTRRLSWLYFRLPPLASLDRASRHLLASGFLLLTLGLAIGMVNARLAWGSFIPEDGKILFSLALWAYYGAGLLVHRARGLSGRRVALLSLLGFLGALLNLTGLTWWLTNVHRF
ncbi:cytochrome C assembly family protein [Limnochorda pilosa]|uniref:Cytochrome C biogenesis protein ResC n=1 Tax=Limnochorda pilosa TaxID=1555112 RepID=A0A0K2SJ26_LIMPI|nr:cytochrome c biogenesis protein CcsA [Limnochorda pilosa]BAS27126.1 cytochrome C biogenesis protein ResC [Limnochorda pilosa]